MIISIFNQKGGVGKSTTTINLSAALAEKSKKVLTIDIDPQGHTTSGLSVNKNNLDNTIYDLLKFKKIGIDKIKDFIIETPYNNLHLLGANSRLSDARKELISTLSREKVLKHITDQLREFYDYIIIDCPPDDGILSENALTASDYLIIPIELEFFAVDGIVSLIDTYNNIKDSTNPNLEVMGILINKYDARYDDYKDVREALRKTFGNKVFSTIIRTDAQIKKSQDNQKPISAFNRSAKGYRDFKNLGLEVLKYAR